MTELNPALVLPLLKWGGIFLVTFGIFIAVRDAVSDVDGLANRYWARYTSTLERKLRPMFIWTPGRVIALAQVGVLAVVSLAHFVLPEGLPLFPVWLVAAAAGPIVYIENERVKRRAKIEEQLDNFVMSLANALKAIPSISAAFNSVVPILQPPIRDEVELATKEMKVGSSLDQALLHMAARIGSRQVDASLSAILIGRQVGGNLAKVLESTATSLREMSRLEGVIRSKTAEGKMQLWVIGALPLLILVMMNYLSPGFFDPMQSSVLGYMLSGGAAGCWVGALILARKVLAVDI